MTISIISTFYKDIEMMKIVMNSVLCQDYDSIEHIVVDGGSGEEVVKLLKEYEKKYNECGKTLKWISEKDSGIPDAVNKGTAMSSGDYIIFTIDKYKNSTVISKIMSVLIKSKADYCYGGLIYQQNGEIIRQWSGKPGNYRLGWMIATPTLCYKRSVWDKHGPYIEKYKVAHDYDFQIKLFMDKELKSISIPEPLVIYYAGGSSNGSFKARWKAIKECQQVLEDNHVKFAWFTNLCKTIIALFAYTFASHKKIELED